MGTWYKVTFRFKDCGVGGKGQQLQDAFASLLIATGGMPRDGALFFQRSDDFEQMFYYFSPTATQIAGASAIIETHGGVPCPPPSERVNLAVGDDRAREMLWPPKGRSS
jgi:hypothetical protein